MFSFIQCHVDEGFPVFLRVRVNVQCFMTIHGCDWKIRGKVTFYWVIVRGLFLNPRTLMFNYERFADLSELELV